METDFALITRILIFYYTSQHILDLFSFGRYDLHILLNARFKMTNI